jgi:hypothetical protein
MEETAETRTGYVAPVEEMYASKRPKKPPKEPLGGGMVEVVMDADIRNNDEDFILEYKRDQSNWEKRPA